MDFTPVKKKTKTHKKQNNTNGRAGRGGGNFLGGRNSPKSSSIKNFGGEKFGLVLTHRWCCVKKKGVAKKKLQKGF